MSEWLGLLYVTYGSAFVVYWILSLIDDKFYETSGDLPESRRVKPLMAHSYVSG